MGQYFRAVHPIAPCSHRALTERAYTAFWDEIETGIDPRPSTQAIIFAAMFSGVVSMDEDAVYHELGGYTKANWVASLKIGTETALSKANFLRTTSVETMQAFVIYMIPLCRAEVSRAHSVLLAAAVRMAECMGLHRDGEAYGLTPLDTHVRRLIWHQLCFLDIRTCEAQGPRPVIRREDYDTKLPVNCNEDDLLLASLGTPPPEPSDAWTSNTLPLIRFEINEMMRSVWVDRRRLEMQKTTLTQVLTKIEHFRRRMSEKYDHLLTVPHPLQRYARSVMRMLTYRLYIMVLHPYYANAANPMPSRLSHLLVTSGIMVIELGMQLETNQAFKDWAWYVGAYFQYQIALLLATEIHYRPDSSEADRIWTCLDYVFGMDRKVPRETKSLQILREISQRTAIYQQKRKMRGPSSTARAPVSTNAIGGANPSKGHPPANTQQLQHQQQLQQQQHPHPHPHPHPQQPTGYPGQQTPQFRMPPGSNNDDSAQKPEQAYDTHMPGVNSGLTSAVPSQLGVVFAGVSDGHVLWSLPPMAHSPQDSDTSSLSIPGGGGTNPSTAAMAAATAAGIHCSTAAGTSAAPHDPIVVQGSIMENIDWDAMCALFPTDTRTGDLFIQGYHDGNFGIATNWSS
ncbi:hypothetical protein F5Y17DRAFT_424999 [Xylariaceae sp. FL0594]|nr:hypothetical protein F5Y17DRAFT_424999 [Xylariaceae sp. FL0594]